jgi:hypothetical protein
MKRISSQVRVLCVLLFLDILIIAAHIFLRGWLGFFDLDKEGGLKSVFSGFQLISNGTAAALITTIIYRIHANRSLILVWMSCVFLFVYLALDDLAMVHERVGFVINRMTGLQGMYESFNWMVYYSPFIVIGAFVLFFALRFLHRIDPSTGLYSFLGGSGFIATLAAEFIGGELLKNSMTQLYFSMIIIEEGALLIGESFILCALVKGLATLFAQTYTLDKTVTIDRIYVKVGRDR